MQNGTGSLPILFGCGNPLLDIQLHTDEAFLQKYKLKPNSFCFQTDVQEGIYDDMKMKGNICYIAGGATLNSIRVCQGLAKKNGTTFYTGTIANDEFGQQLESLCNKEGVETGFNFSETFPTGVCGVAIVEKERTMCTRLAAAADYKLEILKNKKCSKALDIARIAYCAGFFLTVCPDGLEYIGKMFSYSNRIFCTSLSATFVVEYFKDQMLAVLPYVDILFGNETEFAHFAKIHNLKKSDENFNLLEVARSVAAFPKVNKKRPRIVVITQGSLPTIVATEWNGLFKVIEYPVIPLDKKDIVDTNAAGDALVGGFLYGLLDATEKISVRDLDIAIHYGHLAARHVIQKSGCCFNFDEENLTLPPAFQ